MKSKIILALTMCMCLSLIQIMSSCKKDDPIAAPIAGFSGTLNGKSVTFVNSSTTADTYAWDFGDGGTSTEKSPTHLYKSNGSYVVKLSVKNASGTNVTSKVFDIVNITLDGKFTDWSDVPSLGKYADGEAGTIKEIKMENLGTDKLFVYIKTTDKSFQFFDFYIDSNNDPKTGFQSSYFPLTYGIDILFEGYLAAKANKTAAEEPFLGQYDDAGNPVAKNAWAWKQLTPTSNFLKNVTPVKTGADTEIELVLDITEFPGTTKVKDAINFFLIDVAPPGSPKEWSELGIAPSKSKTETSKGFTYKFSLK